MSFLQPIIEEVDAEIIPLFGNGGPAAGEQAPTDPGAATDKQVTPWGVPPNAPGWHQVTSWSKVFHAIFGGAASKPNPSVMSQAEINARLSMLTAQLNASLATAAGLLELRDDWLQLQVTANRTAALNNLNGAVAAINAEIAAISRITGVNMTQAVATAVADANAYTNAKVGAESAARVASDNSLAGKINHAIADAAAWANHAEDAAKAYALAKVTTEADTRAGQVAALQRNLARVENTAAVNLSDAVVTLHTDINDSLGTAEAYARSLVPGTVALAVTDAVGQVEPAIARLATEVDECLTPLCDTVTPNAPQLGRIGNLLKGLESLALPALLMGLVAEAVADPQSAADQITAATGWADGLAVELAGAVLG